MLSNDRLLSRFLPRRSPLTLSSIPAILALLLGPPLSAAASGEVLADPRDLRTREGTVALFFVMTDCPVSNRFAPEIGRICSEYAEQGLRCSLAYVDPDITKESAQAHRERYGISVDAVLDPGQALVEQAGASITPEVALFSSGDLRYLGRINNFYAALGRPRRKATVHDLRDALDAVFAGKEVANPRTQAIGCYIPPKSIYEEAKKDVQSHHSHH